ncbi:MAG: CorA family divalent cation transporter [Clostridia bacterium]
MYYRLLPELAPIERCQIDPNVLTAGYIDAADLEETIEYFGFTDVTAASCLTDRDNYRNLVDVFENYTYGLVSIVEVGSIYDASDRLAFFLRKNLFLVVCIRDDDGSMHEHFVNSLRRYKPENVTLEKLIFAMLESTITRDGQELAQVVQRVTELEEAVVLNKATKSLNVRIYEQKKQLLILRGYYDQLIDLGECLEENENDIFESDSLHYFGLLTSKAERLSRTINTLCDELNQLRDALTATLDYRLNHIMEIFTIISGVFLPLTLLVGWYGMNFRYMPELESPLGYPLFALGCLVLVIGCMIVFKKKKWF